MINRINNMKIPKIYVLILLLFFFGNVLFSQSEIVLISQDAPKRVHVPHEDIGNSWWQDLYYDDSTWELCEGLPGGIGYEKGTGYEELISLDVGSEMHEDGGNPNPSCFIRIPFELDGTDLESILYLKLAIRYDDGFKAYLNSKKIVSTNAPMTENWDSFATSNHEANEITIFDISAYISYLETGENLLAIHGMNVSNQSSDFLITAEMIASDNLYGDFYSSNLPIFHINTNGQTIPDEPKINATMQIISNGPGEINRPTDLPTDYDGIIGVEIRGAYSSTFPQKPYGIETRDDAGNNLNVPLLGMPKENDWALITNYNEKSLVRTTLAFDLYRKMGYYVPRARLCEVLVNDVYQGIYVFSETIKRDSNRVNVSKLRPEENSGDDLTGGYIIKIDYYSEADSWLSNFAPPGHPEQDVHFVYHYPKADIVTVEQKSYIQDFIDNTQTALFGDNFYDPLVGYQKYIDVDSFIDYFILSEVSKNVDGYKKSRYFYKDKNSKGGLLYAGPIWDFDWAWKNIGEWAPTDGSGWGYTLNDYNPDINPPGWYLRLLEHSFFTEKLIERYFELRSTVIDLNKMYADIDSVVNHVGDAQERHFELWPIDEGYIAPEPGPPSQSYEEEIAKLKEWIRLRLNWLDENIPNLRDEITTIESKDLSDSFPTKPHLLNNFPNPFNPTTAIGYRLSAVSDVKLSIYNLLGQKVVMLVNGKQAAGSYKIEWDGSGFASGIYYYRIEIGKFQDMKKMVLLK
jgi:hypothetical protein